MTLGDITGRILGRMELSPSDPQALSAATAAANEGQRLFAFLTLCQENTRQFILTPGTNFYHMYAEGWNDWLAPLRVRLSNDTSTGQDAIFDNVGGNTATFNEQAYTGLTVSSKPKLRPATLYEMASENSAWMNATGTPTHYGCIGWDLLFLDRNPTQSGQTLLITYARSTLPLANPADVPEIPDADHECLIDYGTWRLRCNEGGQELEAAKPLLKSYLDSAKMRAGQVRTRSMAERYDRLPVELENWDYSRLLASRKDLPPYRKEDRWTGQP